MSNALTRIGTANMYDNTLRNGCELSPTNPLPANT